MPIIAMMKFNLVLVIFFAFCRPDFVLADESCPEVRLDVQPGVMSRILTTDQGSSNLCYAFAAAQLLDAQRAQLGALTSATDAQDLANKTMHDFPLRNSIYGGWAEDALLAGGAGVDFAKVQSLSRDGQNASSANMRVEINKQLLLGAPLIVNFCSEVVHNENYSTPYGQFGSCARHYAVVVGQSFDVATKSCRYLVRDSLCGSYGNDASGRPRCDNGQFWIHANPLVTNTDALIWL